MSGTQMLHAVSLVSLSIYSSVCCLSQGVKHLLALKDDSLYAPFQFCNKTIFLNKSIKVMTKNTKIDNVRMLPMFSLSAGQDTDNYTKTPKPLLMEMELFCRHLSLLCKLYLGSKVQEIQNHHWAYSLSIPGNIVIWL